VGKPTDSGKTDGIPLQLVTTQGRPAASHTLQCNPGAIGGGKGAAWTGQTLFLPGQQTAPAAEHSAAQAGPKDAARHCWANFNWRWGDSTNEPQGQGGLAGKQCRSADTLQLHSVR
jgi:hypothetical protein